MGLQVLQVFTEDVSLGDVSEVTEQKMRSGNPGGSRERILPTCGPSLITPKGQRRDPDASDDNKTKTKEIKNNSTPLVISLAPFPR